MIEMSEKVLSWTDRERDKEKSEKFVKSVSESID